MILYFSVHEQTVSPLGSTSVPRVGSSGYLQLSFEFDESWDKFPAYNGSRTIFFQKDKKFVPVVLDESGIVDVPPYFTATAEGFMIMLVGISGSVTCPTNAISISLEPGGEAWRAEPADLNIPAYQQLVMLAQQAVEEAEAIKEELGKLPANFVTSVAGKTGDVMLDAADIAANVDGIPADNVAVALMALLAAIGDLGNLSTTAKESLVAAINEVFGKADNAATAAATAQQTADNAATAAATAQQTADQAATDAIKAAGAAAYAVKYRAQDLSASQKKQARKNIGAPEMGVTDVTTEWLAWCDDNGIADADCTEDDVFSFLKTLSSGIYCLTTGFFGQVWALIYVVYAKRLVAVIEGRVYVGEDTVISDIGIIAHGGKSAKITDIADSVYKDITSSYEATNTSGTLTPAEYVKSLAKDGRYRIRIGSIGDALFEKMTVDGSKWLFGRSTDGVSVSYTIDRDDTTVLSMSTAGTAKIGDKTVLTDAFIAEPTSADAGKVLTVSGGLPAWTDKSPCIVNMVKNADGTYTADKTFSELKAAHDAGRTVICSFNDLTQQWFGPYRLPVVGTSDAHIGFAGVIEPSQDYKIFAQASINKSGMGYTATELRDLPKSTTDDNGKVLTVAGGLPAWKTNDPYVDVTAGYNAWVPESGAVKTVENYTKTLQDGRYYVYFTDWDKHYYVDILTVGATQWRTIRSYLDESFCVTVYRDSGIAMKIDQELPTVEINGTGVITTLHIPLPSKDDKGKVLMATDAGTAAWTAVTNAEEVAV